jgi:hypothetical protein
MTGVLHAAIMALQALPPEALSHADDVTVHKFHRLVMQWIQRSAKEERERANKKMRDSRRLGASLRERRWGLLRGGVHTRTEGAMSYAAVIAAIERLLSDHWREVERNARQQSRKTSGGRASYP